MLRISFVTISLSNKLPVRRGPSFWDAKQPVAISLLGIVLGSQSQLKMESERQSQTVLQFLDLVEEKKYKKAAEELASLVQRAGTLQEEESDKHQRKAFKKLTNLMSNKDAVRAMLSLVADIPVAQLPLLLESLTKLCVVPTFAEQLEACGIASTLHSLHKDRVPGATHDSWATSSETFRYGNAVAEALPGLCTALLAGSFAFHISALSRRLLFCVLDAASCFLRDVDLLKEEAVAQLEDSVTKYAVFIRKLVGAPCFARPIFRSDVETLFVTGRWFMRTFEKLAFAGQQLERASSKVVCVFKTSLVTCLEAWSNSGVGHRVYNETEDLGLIQRLLLYLEEPLQTTFELRLKICEAQSSDYEDKGQATRVGSLGNVRGWVEKLGTDREQALEGLRAPDWAEVLQAYLIATEKGAEVNIQDLLKPWAVEAAADLLMSSGVSLEDALFSLKLLDVLVRGTDLLGQGSEGLFRYIGFRTLAWAERLDVQKLFAEDSAALLRVLMTSFASGGKGGLRKKKPALVTLLLRYSLKLHSEPAVSDLAWHFLYVMLFHREGMERIETGLIDRWDPHCLRDGLRLLLCEKPPMLPKELVQSSPVWFTLDQLTRDELAVCALEALARTVSLAVERRTDCTPNPGQAMMVLEKCVDDTALIGRVCRPRASLLFTSLSDAFALTYEALESGKDAEQWLYLVRELFLLVGQVATHGEVFARVLEGLDDVARAKGASLGALVARGLKKGFFDLPGARSHKDWLMLLVTFVEDVWRVLARRLGLEKCSNQKCLDGVLEAFKGEFKKCAKCERVQYCSRDCQKKHWKNEHKGECT